MMKVTPRSQGMSRYLRSLKKKSEQFLWNWDKGKVVNMQENPYIYDLIYIKFKF